jgi:Phage capsid family
MEQSAVKPFRRDPYTERKGAMTSFTRAIIARAAAALDNVHAGDYAAATWPEDKDVGLVLRASVTPTLMANATALAPIVIAILEQIKPLTAGGFLFSAGMSLTSLGPGVLKIPGFATSPADFVAENAPIPVEQFVAAGPTLSPFKLASIITASNELIEHSDAETIIRGVLAENVAIGLDAALFSNAAASAARPAGLLNGIAALTPATVTAGKNDAMTDDISSLLNAIAAAAGAGWFIVAAPAQAVALQFRLAREFPNIRASGALPAKTVIAIAPGAFVSVLETPRIDSSIEAIVHMEDTSPAAIANGGGIAAPVRSLFQTNSIGLRIIAPCSWALRAPGAVAWMQNVNW